MMYPIWIYLILVPVYLKISIQIPVNYVKIVMKDVKPAEVLGPAMIAFKVTYLTLVPRSVINATLYA